MEKLKDLEQYKGLLKEYRCFLRTGVTNHYLSVFDVERYLRLGRIYFEKLSNALIFYTDEECFYRLYYMGSEVPERRLEKKEKPLFLKYVYTGQGDKDKWKGLLVGLGLKYLDTSIQIVAHTGQIEGLDKKLSLADRFISRFGLGVKYAGVDVQDEVLKLLEDEPWLSVYHFNYETEDEMQRDFNSGLYRVVENKNHEIIAAQHFVMANGTITGEWLAVKEEYKLQYGVGAALAYHSFVYARGKGIDLYYGWVDVNNSNSLKYHKSVEYTTTNKMADGWIMEGR